MKERWQELLELFLEANEPVTSAELSASLQVSPKTVRNEIKALNQLLSRQNLSIESRRGKGYHLQVKDEASFQQLFQEYIQTESQRPPDDPQARTVYVLERLLFHSDYVKMELLAEELYISRSTLQNDLKHIRSILETYDLEIDHRPGYGIKVIGKETNIRFCISEYLFNQKSSFMEATDNWRGILPPEDLDYIRTAILSSLRKHGIMISDISLQNLITHLAISCKRIQEENQVEVPEEQWVEMRSLKEFDVAKEIIETVENGLHVDFAEEEVIYLTLHLQGTKRSRSDQKIAKEAVAVDPELYRLVRNMVVKIDALYSFQLAEDEELLLHMCLHLRPAINRHRHQMNIRNPLLEDIKKNYPLSFEAALVAADELQSYIGVRVDEHEVGYLALHLEAAQERAKRRVSRTRRCLIVCATGLGSAQLLLYKLEDRFGSDLEVAGTTEYYSLDDQMLQGIDFVITTIPIKRKLPVPVVLVRTVLGDSDLTKIRNMLIEEKKLVERYMVEKYTFLQYDLASPEEVIRFMGRKLAVDGKVGDGYIDSVLERESYAPTSFGNLVAIPHPLEPMGDQTFWSIMTLKKPIEWSDKLVQVIFLLNIDKEKKQEVKPMFQALVKLVDNEKLLLQLLACSSYKEFLQTIKKL
ncbi:BglG family transcription antiterminator [Sediminibacillus halophilus]|uniref:Lichenan operon transcriptional antiterminator n=1 Tax=Sediminibacillus halophilus TaxID=482461 RepID=A0A1G9S6P7_9BACI|nr:BglG family transcription antiterminator [Sediminibacillus halophilus]SDM31072.1 lichenan operon transcriptional antiterminator [Sediminibacillus halophilus]